MSELHWRRKPELWSGYFALDAETATVAGSRGMTHLHTGVRCRAALQQQQLGRAERHRDGAHLGIGRRVFGVQDLSREVGAAVAITATLAVCIIP